VKGGTFDEKHKGGGEGNSGKKMKRVKTGGGIENSQDIDGDLKKGIGQQKGGTITKTGKGVVRVPHGEPTFGGRDNKKRMVKPAHSKIWALTLILDARKDERKE